MLIRWKRYVNTYSWYAPATVWTTSRRCWRADTTAFSSSRGPFHWRLCTRSASLFSLKWLYLTRPRWAGRSRSSRGGSSAALGREGSRWGVRRSGGVWWPAGGRVGRSLVCYSAVGFRLRNNNEKRHVNIWHQAHPVRWWVMWGYDAIHWDETMVPVPLQLISTYRGLKIRIGLVFGFANGSQQNSGGHFLFNNVVIFFENN